MLARFGLYTLAAIAMAAAVFDLTGSAVAALVAASVPFTLGVTNFMPFAGWAVPVAFVAWAVTARTMAPEANAAVPPPAPAVLAGTPSAGG